MTDEGKEGLRDQSVLLRGLLHGAAEINETRESCEAILVRKFVGGNRTVEFTNWFLDEHPQGMVVRVRGRLVDVA